jgi:hypothetical protein
MQLRSNPVSKPVIRSSLSGDLDPLGVHLLASTCLFGKIIELRASADGSFADAWKPIAKKLGRSLCAAVEPTCE